MRGIFLALLVAFGVLGCGAKHNPNGSYERANIENQKALESLDRE